MIPSCTANLRLGSWSALSVFALGVVCVLTGAVGVLVGGGSLSELRQVDPYLGILEVLIVLATPCMVAAIASVHVAAPDAVKPWTLTGLGFALLLAGTTCGVHFVQLTVVRQLDAAATAPHSVVFFTAWPSVLFALDLLAWDVFHGVALLCVAPAFERGGRSGCVRLLMVASGALCLIGTAGPLSGDMRWQAIAVVGYAFVSPVAFLLLGLFWRRAMSMP